MTHLVSWFCDWNTWNLPLVWLYTPKSRSSKTLNTLESHKRLHLPLAVSCAIEEVFANCYSILGYLLLVTMDCNLSLHWFSVECSCNSAAKRKHFRWIKMYHSSLNKGVQVCNKVMNALLSTDWWFTVPNTLQKPSKTCNGLVFHDWNTFGQSDPFGWFSILNCHYHWHCLHWALNFLILVSNEWELPLDCIYFILSHQVNSPVYCCADFFHSTCCWFLRCSRFFCYYRW